MEKKNSQTPIQKAPEEREKDSEDRAREISLSSPELFSPQLPLVPLPPRRVSLTGGEKSFPLLLLPLTLLPALPAAVAFSSPRLPGRRGREAVARAGQVGQSVAEEEKKRPRVSLAIQSPAKERTRRRIKKTRETCNRGFFVFSLGKLAVQLHP